MDFERMTPRERAYYLNVCRFDDEEAKIFERLTRGESCLKISMDLHMSESAVYRRKQRISRKIKLLSF